MVARAEHDYFDDAVLSTDVDMPRGGVHPAGSLLLDRAFRIVEVNSTFCRLVGRRQEELVGRPLETCVHPDDVGVVAALASNLRGGALLAVRATVRVVHRSHRSQTVVLMAVRTDEGGPARFLALCSLAGSPARPRALTAAPDGVAMAERARELIFRFRIWPEPGFDYVSPAAFALTGYPPDAFYGDADFLSTIALDDDHGSLHAVLAGEIGVREPISFRIRHRDGSERWFEQRSTRVFDGERRVLAVECIARDVTEQVLSEQERDDLASVLALEHDVAAAANAAGSLSEALQGAIESICRFQQWPVGHAWVLDEQGNDLEPPGVWWTADPRFDRLAQAHASRAWALDDTVVAAVLHRGAPVTGVAIGPEATGGLSWSSAYPISTDEGVVGVLEFFSDQDEGHVEGRFNAAMHDIGAHLGRVFERARDELVLRRRDADRTEFVSWAAHELRGPAGSIALMATGLARSAEQLPTVELAAALERLAQQADRVKVLTVRLLELGQLEQGRLAVQPERGSLRAIVEQAICSTRAAGASSDRAVEVAIDHELEVLADPVIIDQIVVNLVNNACRYGSGTITIAATAQGGVVTLAVLDEGPGVADELIPHLFQPLRQGLAGPESAGLGLAIVDRLTHLLGGGVSYDERCTTGARFVVEFPALPD